MAKCWSCKKEQAQPFKVIRTEYTPTNKYAYLRKPTIWCEPCWNESVARDEAYAAEIQAEAEAMYRIIKAKMGWS